MNLHGARHSRQHHRHSRKPLHMSRLDHGRLVNEDTRHTHREGMLHSHSASVTRRGDGDAVGKPGDQRGVRPNRSDRIAVLRTASS